MENYTLDSHGFFGKRYPPSENRYPDKAVLAMIGSNGDFSHACRLAEYFSGIGVTAIALAYWNADGLPKEMVKLPLEGVEHAARYLKECGFSKIGVCGISKGGELALLAASMFHEINGVIAISPSYAAGIGFRGIRPVEHSTWSYGGKEIPFTRSRVSLGRVLWKTLAAGEMTTNFIYEEALSRVNPESILRVEQIVGPILLVSADYDSMWPSKLSCEKIIERLEAHAFAYPYRHLNYPDASHMILPFPSKLNGLFKIERKEKEACRKSREALSGEIQQWIRAW